MNNNDGTVSQSIARALQDAGVDIVACVPGSGGTDVFDIFNTGRDRALPFSYHEETAYTLAHGAAIAGKRAAVMMKSHGILKAANSVSDSLYCGVNAALLTIVFTDAGGNHSDTILDIRPFLEGTGVPWQIVQSRSAYSKVQEMILASERTRLPQVLIIESSEAGDKAEPFMVKKLPPVERQYRRDIRQHVLCPFFGRYQLELLQRRNRAEQEGLPEAPDIPEVPDIPFLPSAVPERWRRHTERYSPLFEVFREFRGEIVTGDTGISSLFACPPFDCIDITTCIGGSVPLAVGAAWAGSRDVWAVTGDFAFLAAGHLGLIEARQRELPVKVLLLRNGMSVTTGGQPVPRRLLDTVLCGYEDCILTISNPADAGETRQKLAEAAPAKGTVIVVADYEGGGEAG